MSRTVLVVEDDLDTRTRYVAELKRAGWGAVEAANGELALACLRGSPKGIDIILLDHLLGGISGIEMLEAAFRDNIPLPPVVVLSANLDANTIDQYLKLKVRALLSKPAPTGILPDVLDSFSDPQRAAPHRLPGIAEHQPLDLCAVDYQGTRMHLYLRQSDTQARHVPGAQFYEHPELQLSEVAQRREHALHEYFEHRATQPPAFAPSEPLLIVARRWNSWYPSFFNVTGGAYAILGVPAEGGKVPGILIDPGFRAMDILRRLGIPVACLDTCIITHDHPDHLAGFFEYLAARHVLGFGTSVHCAKPVLEILHPYAGFGVKPTEFNSQHFDIQSALVRGGGSRTLLLAPLETSHHNAGSAEGTRGIIVSSMGTDSDGAPVGAKAVLLGDTEYYADEGHVNAALFGTMREKLLDRDLKVASLHIGCCENRPPESGKHLYLAGLRSLLEDVDYKRSRDRSKYRQKLLVLVSEWGLEHATRQQVLAALPDEPTNELEQAFDDHSLVVETILALQQRFQTLTLLPADVGLVVGIETGRVYLRPGEPPVSPEKVGFEPAGEGLHYFEKP